MKVLLLLVVLVAAFEANCRVNTDGPDLNNLLTELEKPQTYDVDHQMKQDVNEKNQIKLRGKAETRILKKLLDNLKSMKEELTQAKSEMKMELQAIESHQDNITLMNTEMKMELQSIEENQGNVTGKLNYLENINSNQDSKLNDIINKNAEMKIELQSIEENQGNMTGKLNSLENVISNQDSKLNNIINKNTELKENQGNMNTKLDLIIDSIGNKSLNRECTRDMFLFGPSNGRQCFKYFTDSRRSWTAADLKCRAENLVLAEPKEPISLRAYLRSNYNPTTNTWLGARGDGRSIRWLRSGAAISNTSPLWISAPGSRVTTADNLMLLTSQYYLDNNPTTPYYAYPGTSAQYTLCELVMN